MKQPSVTVLDYGTGNLLSVRRGLEHCGANVTVSSDPEIILSASRVILPGVGAFSVGMSQIKRLSLDVVLKEIVSRGTPLLGICLGMQMLLDESEEFGNTQGLGLIPGFVIPVPAIASDGSINKIPHIGWNSLLHHDRFTWHGTLLQEVNPGETVYFVHSFMANPSNANHQIADCLYGTESITAVVAHENITGCQFHPEKSGEVGLKVLRRFLLQ